MTGQGTNGKGIMTDKEKPKEKKKKEFKLNLDSSYKEKEVQLSGNESNKEDNNDSREEDVQTSKSKKGILKNFSQADYSDADT